MAAELTRRSFLKGACCGTLALATSRLWTPAAAFASDGVAADGTLIVVFLRGAMDGLSAVVPYRDPTYYAMRPTIAIPADAVIDLDGRFGLHPELQPLHDLYTGRDLAIVHASGSLDPSRSHFDAQELMERGTDPNHLDAAGWLARHVASTEVTALPLHAMAWGSVPPASLRGDLGAISLANLAGFDLETYADEIPATRAALERLYDGRGGILGPPSRAALRALDLVEHVRTTAPAATVTYPATHLGSALADIARTIKADVGLSAATVDVGGWDLHASAGLGTEGTMAQLLADLGTSLRAFHDDLGDRMATTSVLVMSEFGRRVEENGSNGTDHGSGNVLIALGGGINGGKVHGEWRDLADAEFTRGDVPVLTDYRDVVGEVATERHGSSADVVFPGHAYRPRGLV